MRRPHEPKATDGAKRNKGIVVPRFHDGSAGVGHRLGRPEVIGVVVPAVQIRGVAADHAPVWRQEVGKPDAPARDDADRRRAVKKIMLGRLAADLLVGALPGGRVAVVGHMPLTGFELHGQVAFIVDQAREVVGLRVQLRQVAVCVVGDGPGRGRGSIPPGKTPAVADRDEAVRAASSGVVRVGQVVDERRRVVAALQPDLVRTGGRPVPAPPTSYASLRSAMAASISSSEPKAWRSQIGLPEIGTRRPCAWHARM